MVHLMAGAVCFSMRGCKYFDTPRGYKKNTITTGLEDVVFRIGQKYPLTPAAYSTNR